jgi:hypothetical protein
MTTNFSGSPNVSPSAQIYTFPPRGRFAQNGQPYNSYNTVAHGELPRSVKLASGSGWYHEEAIRESELARKP